MRNGYKLINRIGCSVAVVCLIIFMISAAKYNEKYNQDIEVVDTVNVNGRSFDTITMDQYDRIVDYVYRFAGNDDFAVQYAVAECILNGIEKTSSQSNIDSYLDKLYKERDGHFIKTKFENESEDKQDAIRESVQSALDERTMPSGVTMAIYSTDRKMIVIHKERYTQSYLDNTTIQFYYQ